MRMKILELIIEVVTRADKAIKELDSVERKFDTTATVASRFDSGLFSIGNTALATGDNLSLLGARMAKISAASAVLFAGGAFFLNKAAEEASNLEESVNAVNVVFGEGAASILEFSAGSARAVGLATSEYNQLSTATGALLTRTGIPISEVTDLTIELTKRAADLASVHNTDVKDSLNAINAALRGETEAIRRYAADVTDASLQSFLLSKGIDKKVASLTQEEKTLLRLQLLLKQTEVVQGDFNNTSGDAANLARINGAEYKNLAANIGKTLLPAKTAFLKVVNNLLTSFNNLSPGTQDLIAKFLALAVSLAGLLALAAPFLLIFGKLFTLFGKLAQAIAFLNIASKGGNLVRFLSFFRNNRKLIGTIRTLSKVFKILRIALLALLSPFAVVAAKVIALGLILEDLWTFFRGGESVIGTLIDKFRDFDVLGVVGGWFSDLKSVAMDALSSIWASFSETFPKSAAAAEILGGKVLQLASNIHDIAAAVIKAGLDRIGAGFQGFRDVVGGVIQSIVDWWNGMVDLIVNSPVFGAIEKVGNFVGDRVDRSVDGAKQLGGDIKEFFRSGFDNLLSSSLNLATVPVDSAIRNTNSVNVGDVTIVVGDANADGAQIADDFNDRLNQRSNNILHANGGSSTQ